MGLLARRTQDERVAGGVGEERPPQQPPVARPLLADGPTPEQLVEGMTSDEPWWVSHRWARLIEDPNTRDLPAVAVMSAFAERLQADEDDPVYLIGGPSPGQAIRAAVDWLYWRVPVEAIPGWLAAGCWNAKVVRQLIDQGLTPELFLAEDGSRLAFERSDGSGVSWHGVELAPIAWAAYVMDGTIPVEDVEAVARFLRSPGPPPEGEQ